SLLYTYARCILERDQTFVTLPEVGRNTLQRECDPRLEQSQPLSLVVGAVPVSGISSFLLLRCYVTGVHYLLLLLPETTVAVLVLSVAVANETCLKLLLR
ncbi:hypothetical protein GIB67_004361, partial [Kingdonia uniflora]